MKHMISSFKMKVDVLSDNFLMQWFQKELAGGQNPEPKSDIWSSKRALKIPIVLVASLWGVTKNHLRQKFPLFENWLNDMGQHCFPYM